MSTKSAKPKPGRTKKPQDFSVVYLPKTLLRALLPTFPVDLQGEWKHTTRVRLALRRYLETPAMHYRADGGKVADV
jgi:hypothetical protein